MTDLQEHDELADNEVGPTTPVRGFNTEGPDSQFSENNIVDLLQADLQELAEIKEVNIPVKGYERAGLQIRYRLPDRGKELDEIARRVMREVKDAYSRNLLTAMDTMIHLCVGFYVQPTGVAEPVTLDPDHDGVPVQFDHKLTELLGGELAEPSARNVLRKLFANNDMAIISHAEKLNRWLQNTRADLSLEIWQQGE